MKRSSILVGIAAALLAAAAAPAQRGRGAGPGSVTPRAPNTQHGTPKTHQGVTTPRTAPPSVPARIQNNPALVQRIQPLLPAGMPLDVAAQGFKNQGQFIAALHVSKNLGIPFADLKAKMTGPESVSLGKAIQELKPGMESSEIKISVRTAEREAKADRESAGKK